MAVVVCVALAWFPVRAVAGTDALSRARTLHRAVKENLDDPSLDPFWETAARLGAAVVMHPMFVCGEPRLADYDLVNAIGRLVDSTIAVSRLLFSGHLLKHTGMNFVLCHGGAALPFGLGLPFQSEGEQFGGQGGDSLQHG